MWVEVQEQETSGCTLASDWLWVKGVDLCLALIGPNKKYGSSVVLLFEPLQNMAHGHFLGTPDRSWPDLILLASI